jgi:hypothetical protein
LTAAFANPAFSTIHHVSASGNTGNQRTFGSLTGGFADRLHIPHDR